MTADGLYSSDQDLVVALRCASQDLIDQRVMRDRDVMLSRLVTSAVGMIPAAVEGAISRTEGHRVWAGYATSEAVQQLEELQGRLGEGPCIDAAVRPGGDGIMLARDLGGSDATRWPRFAPRAVEAGFRSMLSVSLIGHVGGRRSALNLYSCRPDAFDPRAQLTAGLFAGHAGALLHGADHVHDLGIALASRDVIGQAKGILMERFGVDGDEAFQMMVKSSQDTNMKLADVARWLVGEAERRAPGR